MSNQPILKLMNDDQHANVSYLAALMTWPDDLSRVQFYTEAAIKDLAGKIDNPEGASILRDYNKEIKKELWPGFVTGQVFLARLHDLSLGKAQYIVAKSENGSFFDGRKRNLSVDSIHRHWRKYKNVSHLWAAYVMLQSTQENEDYNLLVQLSGKLLEMIKAKGGLEKWDPLIVETDKGPFNGEIILPERPDIWDEYLKEYVPFSHYYPRPK